MMNVVSSFIPFPNITWWAAIIDAATLLLDKDEHFQKMSYRNRYNISGSSGLIQLSIPLQKGRNQRSAMKEIVIAPENWQIQHWRTLVSVYNRSPYFEHYQPSLQKLFETQFKYLIDFNLSSLQWLQENIKLPVNKTFTENYQKTYENAVDLRDMKPQAEKNKELSFPQYYQVFSDKIGFLPNLSILDLLFSEGPAAIDWIKQNKEELIRWAD